MYQITDGSITASISHQGAELTSVIDSQGFQRIWQADPQVWGRHAPLLFPVIGRLRNSQYQLDGAAISISTHGFARDLPFTLVEQKENAVTLALEDTPETRQVYPFSFRLEVSYALENGILTKRHTVTNRSQAPMPFELGGHEGYCTTLLPGETMADYGLVFEGITQLNPHRMEAGTCFVCPDTIPVPLDGGTWWDYRPFLAEMDTAIVDRLPTNRVTLTNRAGTKQVIVTYPDFDYLGIWTKTQAADTNYLCIEPWSALPEGTTTGPALTDKTGIRILTPGETQSLAYTVEFV